jgi:ParB family chromosome partitioning protein
LNNGKGLSEKPKTSNRENDANVRAAETKLQRRFGTKIRILPNADKLGGKIEFEYYSDEDLDRIYQILMQSEK